VTVEPAREEHTAAYLEVFENVDAGQRWLVSYHPPDAPPPGTMHGSSAVCLTSDGLVVLVRERDTDNWQLPGGRPEGEEDWRTTLEREVLEEACATVEEATLLGFARSECVEGWQLGTVLVRAFWRARVRLEEWVPAFEMEERRLFTPEEAIAGIWTRPLAPLYRRIHLDALRAGEG
jgi:8-oxo-dGTP pyrophosphatase MutT (NUDIX family)